MSKEPSKRPRKGSTGRLDKLEARIGYAFANRDLLTQALTHSSLSNGDAADSHYERLEFVGDRVLGLAVAEMLYSAFPNASEGELSLRLNLLVKGETLAEISDSLQLHEFIRAGSTIRELTGKRMRSVRADVLEAMIASIYLDGGIAPARDFVLKFWADRIHDPSASRRDAKSELQEWAHAERLGTPEYSEISRSGPDHEPYFVVAVQVPGRTQQTGSGRSKRAAEHEAAQAMLTAEGVWRPGGSHD